MPNAVTQNEFLTQLVAWLAAFAGRCYERIFVELPGWVTTGGNRFYWVYLLSFVVLGALAYRLYYRSDDAPTPASMAARLRSVARFLFPPEVYRHPSALIDYQLLLMNRLLGPASLLSGILLGSFTIAVVASATQEALGGLFSRYDAPMTWSFATSVLFFAGLTLVRDFSTYVTHALHHKIPLLWEFHKVHHSAEVLTPLTVYRKHPVYNVFSRFADILIVGPVQGVFAFLFIGQAETLTLFGANVIFSIFHVLGANLRHSHIWFPFGPRLSHILISPAQHQIHHSKAERHWDKNFGEVFALWDWMFGTLYVPGREREVIEFGVAGSATQEHSTLLRVYVVPFINCARLLRGYTGLPAADKVALPPAPPRR